MNKNRKYNILIVHNYYQIPGGEDSVVINEKKMLESNGHKVFMYTRHNNEIKELNMLGRIRLAFDTIYSIKTIREVKKIIKENKIDIVHVHNTFPLISPSVYKAAYDCGVKVVQTIHNFRLLCPSATFTCNGGICEKCLSGGLKFSIRNKCYRNSRVQTFIVVLMLKINRIIGSYAKVSNYIALTNFSKQKLSMLVPKDKIVVKPNFINKKNTETISVENRNYFMFLGRIDKLKGIDILLDAWKSIKGEKLIIVGSGPEEDRVKNYIYNNKIDNIDFLGYRKKEEVIDLLSKAKALIIPSQWYEGLPMTLVESFSMNVPVIASKLGNLENLVNDGVNGLLFKYDDKFDLANKINQVSNDKELAFKLSIGAKVSFEELYNKEINYQTLINIYSK